MKNRKPVNHKIKKSIENVKIVNQTPVQNQSQLQQTPHSREQQLIKQNYIQEIQKSLDIDQSTDQQPQQQIIINQQQQQ